MRSRWLRYVLGLSALSACSFPEYDQRDSSSPRCDDGLRNGDETAVDCGPSCAPCPECSDGVKNGQEEGVDCGGSCEACASCDDGARNGAESDIDCGGACPIRCEADQRCRENADCASLVCKSVCQPGDCMDGVRNGGETGVDCGGPCGTCGNGSACQADEDCESQSCQDEVCVGAGCTNGTLDGQEADVDCGGSVCAPCHDGQSCGSAADCASLICATDGSCEEASCEDAVQNQKESDIDCGGANCAPCTPGGSCSEASDCDPPLCQNGTCVPDVPRDEPLDRTGWTLSSSEARTELNPNDAFDGDLHSRWSSGTVQYNGMYVDVDLQERRIFFKLELQATESPFNEDYPKSVDVFVSDDGSFGEPVLTAATGGSSTYLDFEAAQVGRYVRIAIHSKRDHRWSIGELIVKD